MREKCYSLRIAIVVATLSFAICCMLWFWFPLCLDSTLINFLQMLFGGILGSSFVSLFIYWSEYRTQKRLTLEKLWTEIRQLNNKYLSISYLDIEEQPKMVAGVLNEQMFGSIDHRQTISDYRRQWIEQLRLEYLNMENMMSDDEFEKMLCENINKQLEEYMGKLKKILDDYIAIASDNWDSFLMLLGEIEYFSGKKARNKIYDRLYLPLDEKRKKIKAQVYPHFMLYKNGKSKNAGGVLLKLLALQQEIFTIETDEIGVHIYNDFWTQMDNAAEDFRTTIYKNEKPIYQPRLEVLCKYKL